MKKLVIIACFLAAPAAAEEKARAFRDGNSIYEICSTNTPTSTAQCVSYTLGAMDMLLAFQSVGSEAMFCLPEKARPQQLSDILVKHLRDHPEERHFSAAGAMISAMSNAFPCANK